MDRALLEDKIRKRQNLTSLNDKVLKVFIAVFLIGNIFFMTSTLTFPKIYKNVHPTPLGTTYELGDYVVTYDAWDWSKKDGIFEIILEIENLSLEKTPKIDFKIRSGEDIYKVYIDKVIDNNLYVLRVEDVKKRFTTASLTMTAYDSTGESSKSDKISIDDRKIGMLTTATSDIDYKIYAAKCKVQGYKSQLHKLKRQQEEYAEKITYSFEKVEELEYKKKTQTKTEQVDTDANISKISNEANDLQALLDESTIAIQELENKIKIQNKILGKLERGDDI